MELTVGTAYSDDMEKVRSVVLEAVKDCPARDPDREIELFFIAFADSSINFQLRVWLDDSSQTAYEHARSQAMIDIKKAFDSHGITIPFPIRTLDFGARALTDDRQEGVRMKVVSGA
jgi:small conductance mechanosensitive channel